MKRQDFLARGLFVVGTMMVVGCRALGTLRNLCDGFCKELAVDPVLLREEVKSKYRDVAINPSGEYHFHTGRPLARRLDYDSALVDSMPDAAVESFAGVANPFSLRSLEQGERVVDAGSGGGFDCFIAAHQIGPQG